MADEAITLRAQLSAEQRSAIGALGAKSLDEALGALASLALEEWAEWLSAEDRPASLTELAKRRVKAMIDAELLPALPTPPVIAQRVRLTLGQARYIASTLALESPAASAETRTALAERLRAELAHVGIAEPEKLDAAAIAALETDESPALSFDAPRAEGELALALHEELLNERYSATNVLDIDGFQPPTLKRRTDSYVRVLTRRHVAVAIVQRLGGLP